MQGGSGGAGGSGRYRLIRRIAAGGMAEVFQARAQGPEGFEKDLCVKRILPHFARDTEFVEMFKNEARLAAKLQHANIVQIFDFGEEDGTYFLAMEYVDGKDLRAWQEAVRQRGERIPIGLSAYIILEAARGLGYAHQKKDGAVHLGIVHRDISPHNLLISRSGEVKVADFGIAKAASRAAATRSGVLKGKVAYMSPEQARGEAVDARSDLFALGAVLHELLVGKRLFQGDTETETLSRVLFGPIPSARGLNPDVPEDLDAIVSKMLHRDREQRFANAESLARELSRFLFTLPSEQANAEGLAAFCAGLEPAVVEGTTHTQLASAPGTEPTVNALATPQRARAGDPTMARGKDTAPSGPPSGDTFAGAATSATRSELRERPGRRRRGVYLAAAVILAGAVATTGSLLWPVDEDPSGGRAAIGIAPRAASPASAGPAELATHGAAPREVQAPRAPPGSGEKPSSAGFTNAGTPPEGRAGAAAIGARAASASALPGHAPASAPPAGSGASTPPAAKLADRAKVKRQKKAPPAVASTGTASIARPAPSPVTVPAVAAHVSAPPVSPPPVSAPAPEPAKAPGFLQITAIPWAEIFVDGKLIAKGPSAALRVPAGLRKVRLRNTERDYDRTFDVPVGAGDKRTFVREVGGN